MMDYEERERLRDLRVKNAGLGAMYRETDELYEAAKKENLELRRQVEQLKVRLNAVKGEQP